MYVLARQRYRFEIKGKGDVFVHPSRTPQLVPDELESVDLFKLAKKDGSIQVIEIVPPEPAAAVPELPTEKTAKAKK